MINKVLLVLSVVICELITQCQTANILMLFTIPSLSNHLMYRPIIDAVASKNHSVVVVTTDPTPVDEKTWPNVVEIDVHDISYEVWTKHLDEYTREVSTSKDKLLFIAKFAQMSVDITSAQLSSSALKGLIQSEKKFDVVIGSIMHLTNLAVAKKFDAPFIGVHPSDVPNTVHNCMGNSFANSYYPDPFYPQTQSLASIEGVKDRYNQYRLYKFIANTATCYDDTAFKHLNIQTNSIYLLEKTDLMLLITYQFWSSVRPIRSNTLYVGDTRLRPGKPLTYDLKKLLQDARQGVVYFSLGTNLKSSNLTTEGLKVILQAMKSIPYLVLMKWESTDLPELPNNVITAPWFPQQDILAHPNVKVFVTHGGLLSISEALYHEVPVVVIPFFGDQHFNAMRVKDLGIGEVLDYKSMTAKDLEMAVMNVGTNNSFTEKMELVSDRLFDQQVSSVEAAVWWVEYIIRHRSGSHFQHPRISTTEYLMLDVIGVAAILMLIIIAGLFKFLNMLVNRFFCKARARNSRFTFAPQKKT